MNRPENRLLPTVVSASEEDRPRDPSAKRGGRASKASNPYAAQMLGQDGQKRGLRGGAPVLDAARSAYLGAEYSGENDRRPASGLIMKKAI